MPAEVEGFSAVVRRVDHHRGRDGTRLHCVWFGEGNRIKRRALSLAIEMARVA